MRCSKVLLLSAVIFGLGCGSGAKRSPSSVAELLVGAQQGDPAAQYKLGSAYERGEGVTKSPTDALQWYRKAADQGYAPAQNDLGSIYQFGVGVERDYGQAVKFFQMAVDQDLAIAYSNLGYMYDKGLGIREDKTRAAELYRIGAEKGSVEGMLNLGVSYWRGEGVPRDLIRAHMWLDLARHYGKQAGHETVYRRARAAWFDIKMEMTSDEIRTAERLAKEWSARKHVQHDQSAE